MSRRPAALRLPGPVRPSSCSIHTPLAYAHFRRWSEPLHYFVLSRCLGLARRQTLDVGRWVTCLERTSALLATVSTPVRRRCETGGVDVRELTVATTAAVLLGSGVSDERTVASVLGIASSMLRSPAFSEPGSGACAASLLLLPLSVLAAPGGVADDHNAVDGAVVSEARALLNLSREILHAAATGANPPGRGCLAAGSCSGGDDAETDGSASELLGDLCASMMNADLDALAECVTWLVRVVADLRECSGRAAADEPASVFSVEAKRYLHVLFGGSRHHEHVLLLLAAVLAIPSPVAGGAVAVAGSGGEDPTDGADSSVFLNLLVDAVSGAGPDRETFRPYVLGFLVQQIGPDALVSAAMRLRESGSARWWIEGTKANSPACSASQRLEMLYCIAQIPHDREEVRAVLKLVKALSPG